MIIEIKNSIDNKLGNTIQDSNVVLSLFSPARYEMEKHRGYDIAKLKNRYVSLGILK